MGAAERLAAERAHAPLPVAYEPPPRHPLWGRVPSPRYERLGIDAFVAAGAMLPSGELSRHVRAGVAYGVGMAAEWRLDMFSAARLTASWARAQLTAKAPGQSGPLLVNPILVRADYVFGHSWWRPFAGLGLGVVPWWGRVRDSLGRENRGRGASLAGRVAAGVEVNLVSQFSLVPEATWTQVGGAFKASLWDLSVGLRARL